MTARCFCILGLMLVSGCGSVDDTVREELVRAQQLFAAASTPDDFAKAAAAYQAVVDRGVVSGPLLYNQGNAFMQAGQTGRAVAAYRQALRYRPRDPYLQANLKNALADALSGRPKLLAEYIFFWQNWISYPAKFHLVTGLVLLTVIALAAWMLGWNLSLARPVTICCAVLLTVCLGSALYDVYRYEWTEHGVTIAEIVARKGNSESYEPAFTQPVAEATEFIVQERRGSWVHVWISGAGEAWVPADQVVLY